MAKRNNKLKRAEELELAKAEEIFNSFREVVPVKASRQFNIEDMFKNVAQRFAFSVYEQHDIIFLLGPAGTGKSHISCMFAINDLIKKNKERIFLTRPIVEAGENLGFLPGDFAEKTDPYMLPLYDCIRKLVPDGGALAENIKHNTEIAPIAYLRGRAQPLDAIIYTPSGPKCMAEIKEGDYVIGSSGTAVKVLGVFLQGEKDVYKISFSDGSATECCGDHLWTTRTLSEKRHNKPYSVKTTWEIMSKLKNNHGVKNHQIPVLSSPANFDSQKVPLDPYLLGALLGDGSIHEKDSIGFTNESQEIVSFVKNSLPEGVVMKPVKSSAIDYRFVKQNKGINYLKSIFRDLSLLGKKSFNKFVPDIYKYNEVAVRLSVLQGLMDTDGSIYYEKRNGASRMEFYSTSEQLAKDVMFLVRSLGGTAYYRKRQFTEKDSHIYKNRVIRHVHPLYVVGVNLPNINPFRISRKASKFTKPYKTCRLISNVDFVGRKICQCIKVDADDSLYLTDDCVLTHNTMENSVCILDEAQNCTYNQFMLYLTRLGENSKMIITGDPTQSDIGNQSALMDVVRRLEGVSGIGKVQFTDEHIVRHKLVGEIIKRLQSH